MMDGYEGYTRGLPECNVDAANFALVVGEELANRARKASQGARGSEAQGQESPAHGVEPPW